ncbi:MAG: ornithine carbamoyltransferase, partial [Planctomycetota bacterium]
MTKGASVPELSDRLRGRQLPHIGLLSREDLDEVIALGEWFRDNAEQRAYSDLLRGRLQALLFVYESTRTRLGFEAAMAQLGGSTTYLAVKDTQMGRGETIADTARALDQYIDVFAGRLWTQDDMQAVADSELMCMKQAKGRLEGLNLVYTGMARGILHSFMRVCPVLEINLTLAIPESYARTLNQEVLAEGRARAAEAGTKLEICTDLMEAVKDVDYIQASTLIRSMLAGEQSPEEKEVEIPKWTVTDEVLAAAKPDVLYTHSGPAHRNICATDSVMDGPKSLIPEEARNAIFSKKALLALM